MAAFSNSVVFSGTPKVQLSSGSALKLQDLCFRNGCATNFPYRSNHQRKLQLSTSRKSSTVRAAYRDEGRLSNSAVFVGGFVLGSIIVGTLGCVFASQDFRMHISKALAGVDREEIMKKLPKFIYDKERLLPEKKVEATLRLLL